jgi:molybdopterin molybdotransferase
VGERPIDIDEARRRVLGSVRRLAAEPVALADAAGRVTAAPIVAGQDVPGFDNSAMDGFAVVAADTRGATAGTPVELALVGESRAGHPATSRLSAGTAIRISTGAMVPAGADAVVRVEDTSEVEERVGIAVAVESGRNVRRAGEDIRAGDTVIAAGTAIGPAELGVLASVDAAQVACARRPRAAVLTTGDELRPPGTPLPAGGVRDTNAWSVPAQARAAGAQVELIETVADDPQATVEAIGRGLDCDLLVVCGGVSVGAHDHVKPAFEQLDVRREFWGVALRPGKPTWFGVRESASGRALVFGLPGNPVSAMVTFHLFARPALRAMVGADPDRSRVTATMDEDCAKAPGRAHAVRCRLNAHDDGWHVRPTTQQGSHVLTSMLGADALALLEASRGDVRAGERVQVELLDRA